MRIYFLSFRMKGAKQILMLASAVIIVALIMMKFGKDPVASANAPVYQGNAKDKKIALTFNVVWGEEHVSQILGILKENGTPGTFFIGGQWAEDFPELVKDIFNSGHEVGSHGYSHPHPDRISKLSNINEIKKTEDILFKITGVKPVLFAPPYGERGEVVLKAAEETGYTVILWSIDTIDWQLPPPELMVLRVAEKAHNGAIVLMHPTVPTVKALAVIIQELKKQGYELVKVSVLLDGLKKDGANK